MPAPHHAVVQSATSLPLSPEQDRHKRMVRYTIAMSIRLICFILAVIVPTLWGHVLFGAAAAVLPYVAVVLANATSSAATNNVNPTTLALPAPVQH